MAAELDDVRLVYTASDEDPRALDLIPRIGQVVRIAIFDPAEAAAPSGEASLLKTAISFQVHRRHDEILPDEGSVRAMLDLEAFEPDP